MNSNTNTDNSKFFIVREDYQAATENESREKAISSANTAGVAAAATCGIAIKDFTRTVEDTPEGAKTVVSWHLDEDTVEFTPNFKAERIRTGELLRRFRDEAWLRSNPDHPITYMAFHAEATRRLAQCAREKAPLVVFRKGKSTAFLTLRGDKEKQTRLLTKAGFNATEIGEILTNVGSQ